MNMNKALQDLYYAVSGSTTNKRNITKLLLDIHYAITGKESENKNNHARIIDSLADNWPSGGGGGGSSDFSTAEVTFIASGEYIEMLIGVPYISENEILTFMLLELNDGETATLNVPLYKGNCACLSTTASFSNATGGVSIGEQGRLIITGDGTASIGYPM